MESPSDSRVDTNSNNEGEPAKVMTFSKNFKPLKEFGLQIHEVPTVETQIINKDRNKKRNKKCKSSQTKSANHKTKVLFIVSHVAAKVRTLVRPPGIRLLG